ncbi:MAG TPA: DUF4124 domain-containing protein [Usitatibacter sp.]|nr:DUF4124 domain-containing protein [Usitatibacter sp.]
MRPPRAALLLAALLAVQGTASAQVLYKWIDKDGRTQYSDQPPKNFPGPVTRIEPDEKATAGSPAPKADASPAKAQKANEDTRAIIQMAEKKRAERDALEARVVAARERLAALKAQRDNASPGDGERQVIQQRMDQGVPLPGAGSSTTGGMFGMGAMNGTAPRSNCTTSKNAAGNNVIMCPTSVPNESYYDRMKQLDDAVKAAEDELDAAETAYRRGVD